MYILKFIIILWISITSLNCTILYATFLNQEKAVKNNLTKGLNGVGEFREEVLHVSAIEAADLLEKNTNIKVLDVRTKWEYRRGHIKGAVTINYYWFGFKKKLASLDRETTWLVHCKSGVRSGRTLPLMKEMGFKSIVHMDGGFNRWRDANLPIFKVEKR